MTEGQSDSSYVQSVHTPPGLEGTQGVKMAMQAFGGHELWVHEHKKNKCSTHKVFWVHILALTLLSFVICDTSSSTLESQPQRRGIIRGFLGGSDGKASACNAGDLGLIPGSERCPEEAKSYPLQYFCLENSMDRGVWQATENPPAIRETTVQFLGWDDALEKG